jgi:pimeloyl-ACP methyl ester carboxylesterase
MQSPDGSNGATSTFISAPDGLRLHARCYGRRSAPALPVVCLPGLARTAEDFVALASALAGKARRVIALDYRGRGLSRATTVSRSRSPTCSPC